MESDLYMFLHFYPMFIRDLKFLAKGKRSNVYVGRLNKKMVAVKVSKRAKIEARWLRLLNKKGIGPKLIKVERDRMIYDFIGGKRIGDCLKNKNSKKIIKKVLRQCRILDKLKINKKELTNPYKHILINKDKVVMIDFERCHKVKKGKNVTQFCEYLMRNKVIARKKLTPLLKKYKENQTEINFEKVLKSF